MVERSARNRQVPGSIPGAGSTMVTLAFADGRRLDVEVDGEILAWESRLDVRLRERRKKLTEVMTITGTYSVPNEGGGMNAEEITRKANAVEAALKSYAAAEKSALEAESRRRMNLTLLNQAQEAFEEEITRAEEMAPSASRWGKSRPLYSDQLLVPNSVPVSEAPARSIRLAPEAPATATGTAGIVGQ